MSNIQGLISSSLGIVMSNVTMSFFTASDNTITYTTHSNVSGIYTQSVSNDWSGSLRPTGSGYEFFYSINNSGSIPISASSFDITRNWTGVKNFTSGSGASTNPYYVLNYEDFNNLRYRTGSNSSGLYYKLGADIDLSYFTNWYTINPHTRAFNGTLDGNNYTISNMTITTGSVINPVALDDIYIGLLGNTNPAGTTKDLTLNSCSVDLTGWTPTNNSITFYMSIFTARAQGTQAFTNIKIKNSTIKWVPNALQHNNRLYLGAMLGYNQQGTSIASCSVEDSTMRFENRLSAGGNSFANGVSIGGIVGEAPSALFKHGFVKNSTFRIYPHPSAAITRYEGLFGGGITLLARDCYVLSCSVSSSNITASAFSVNISNTSRNNYVALINYTDTPTNNRIPFSRTGVLTSSYYESGTFTTTAGYTATGITGSTTAQMQDSASYINWDFQNIWSINGINNYGYPYLYNEEFPITTASPGLTLYYDSRIGYISASNIWTDLTNSGSDATTKNTFPTASHLYFGTAYGPSSASFSSIIVSESFGIEIWTAPTTQSGQLIMFSTVSGTFPRIEAYITGTQVYFAYQGSASVAVSYLTSSNDNINKNKFNHIAFYISGSRSHLWSNGTLFGSASINTGSWTGGTIGILDTLHTNQYYGYIDVFKVWNGMQINTTEAYRYHYNRNYFNKLPSVNYPV